MAIALEEPDFMVMSADIIGSHLISSAKLP
jgi:hypothetical protein